MPSSNKTGLVFKISIVLLVLLTAIVYKINDYFKNEQRATAEAKLHQKTALMKTAVASQISQIRNTLSSYEQQLDETQINWVQLDPFFAIAHLDVRSETPLVTQLLVRSGTPAERWSPQFLNQALLINKPQKESPVMAQMFQNKLGAKFLVLRFSISGGKQIAVVSGAEFFQKFFDLERGEKSVALLSTAEDVLVAHSEGDYIATMTAETRLSKKKYLFEKDEISGTNLIVMNYILKTKVSSGFAVPWSMVGVILGFGCILIAVLFYSLDPMERKMERYKRQERAQIYKDTLGGLVTRSTIPQLRQKAAEDYKAGVRANPESVQNAESKTEVAEKNNKPPKNFYSTESSSVVEEIQQAKPFLEEEGVNLDELTAAFYREEKVSDPIKKNEETVGNEDQFFSINNEKIDLNEIEKALALDDFDSEVVGSIGGNESLSNNRSEVSSNISLSTTGAPIDKPQFNFEKKEYRVDKMKVHIRAAARNPVSTEENK